jgi:hypothetical protein
VWHRAISPPAHKGVLGTLCTYRYAVNLFIIFQCRGFIRRCQLLRLWMCIEQWWNESEKWKSKYSEKSYCFFQHKPHTDWPGLEPGPPRWRVVILFKLIHLLYQFLDYQTTFNELVPSRDVPVHIMYKLPSLRINFLREPITLTDDRSVIMSCASKMSDDFCTVSNLVLSHMSKFLATYKLALTLDKTNTIKFITNNSPH